MKWPGLAGLSWSASGRTLIELWAKDGDVERTQSESWLWWLISWVLVVHSSRFKFIGTTNLTYHKKVLWIYFVISYISKNPSNLDLPKLWSFCNKICPNLNLILNLFQDSWLQYQIPKFSLNLSNLCVLYSVDKCNKCVLWIYEFIFLLSLSL
jgi:hypothetical protein